MARALSPDERAIWARVTVGVAAEKANQRPRRILNDAPEPMPVRKARAPGTTLDASWDRRLRLGEVVPDRVIDLHGLTLDAAHVRALGAVRAAARTGDRLIVLITGKPPAPGASRLDSPLRGVIRASIRDWLAAADVAPHIAAVRPAHRRHGGEGAIYVILRRKRFPSA